MPVVVDVRELDGLPEILGPRRLLASCERRLTEEGQIELLVLNSSMELLANWYDALLPAGGQEPRVVDGAGHVARRGPEGEDAMTRRDAVGAILVLAVAVASFLVIVWAVAEVGGRVVGSG